MYFLYACYCMRTCIIYYTECLHHMIKVNVNSVFAFIEHVCACAVYECTCMCTSMYLFISTCECVTMSQCLTLCDCVLKYFSLAGQH